MTDVWVDAAAFDDLWDGAGVAASVGDREVSIFRIGEALYATDLLCTHGNARLCDGFIEGHEIECPLHQGKFDLRTGAATCEPAVEAIKTHAVRIDGARVEVLLSS